MTAFKKEILTRFIGTDEGEVTEYIGCELIHNVLLHWMLTPGSQRKIVLRVWTQPFIVALVVSLDSYRI